MTVTYDTSRVTLVDHPLVQHKLSILRDKNTGTNQFRQLVRELALFDGYEAMRDLPMEDVEVETPITTATFKQLAGKKLAIVPILRAGLGMVDGILDLVPSARVGHIGMERDEVTHEPHEYYCKMPKDIDQRICLVVDPMLATGGSAEMAISYLRERGVKDIRMLCIVAAPEGLKSLTEKDPDVHIYTCAIDDHLNEAAYIVPGLGDAGDLLRCFAGAVDHFCDTLAQLAVHIHLGVADVFEGLFFERQQRVGDDNADRADDDVGAAA